VAELHTYTHTHGSLIELCTDRAIYNLHMCASERAHTQCSAGVSSRLWPSLRFISIFVAF